MRRLHRENAKNAERPNAGAVAEGLIIVLLLDILLVGNPGGRIYIQCHQSTVNFSINTMN